jgi:hypothetical protein
MKAKLIKKADGWYNLYDGEIGIGSTHPELQGYKLAKQNCDEIFGVVDVEKLFNEVGETIDFHEFCFSSFKLGLNKAMELNRDKVFTLEDMRKAMDWVMAQYFEFHEQPSTGRREHYLQLLQQPIVIEVEIVMKDSIGITDLYTPDNDPKLDEKRCLILKKI